MTITFGGDPVRWLERVHAIPGTHLCLLRSTRQARYLQQRARQLAAVADSQYRLIFRESIIIIVTLVNPRRIRGVRPIEVWTDRDVFLPNHADTFAYLKSLVSTEKNDESGKSGG